MLDTDHTLGHVSNPSTKSLDLLPVHSSGVMKTDIAYHWQCICCQCAYAISCDLFVGANFYSTLKSLTPIYLFTM